MAKKQQGNLCVGHFGHSTRFTGMHNTAVGYQSLYSKGSFNPNALKISEYLEEKLAESQFEPDYVQVQTPYVFDIRNVPVRFFVKVLRPELKRMAIQFGWFVEFESSADSSAVQIIFRTAVV